MIRHPVTSKNTWIIVCAFVFVSGCGAVQVGQDVQAGRNALQTRRPQDAVSPRAAQDPDYAILYRLRVAFLLI
jgi:hypothetical protein